MKGSNDLGKYIKEYYLCILQMVEVQDEIFHTTLDDEFDRKNKYTNSCGFTDDVLRRRDLEMKELIKKLTPTYALLG